MEGFLKSDFLNGFSPIPWVHASVLVGEGGGRDDVKVITHTFLGYEIIQRFGE